jgi:hypothetical protein
MNQDEQEFLDLSNYIKFCLDPISEHNSGIPYFDSSRTICLFAEYSNSNIYQAPYRALLSTPDRRVFKYNKFKPETNTLFLEIEEPGIYTFHTAKDFKRYKVYYSCIEESDSYVDIFEENHLPERILMNEVNFLVRSLLTEILEGFSGTDMYDDDPY